MLSGGTAGELGRAPHLGLISTHKAGPAAPASIAHSSNDVVILLQSHYYCDITTAVIGSINGADAAQVHVPPW